MNLAKLGVNFVRRRARFEKRKKVLQDEIDAMNRRHHAVSFKTAVLYPIAKAILKELPDYKTFDITGPCGLSCEHFLSFYKTMEHEAEDEPLSISFVNFDHEKGKLFVRDYTRKRGDYKEGSLGEINGMNFDSIEVPPDADSKWFVNLMVAFRLRHSA